MSPPPPPTTDKPPPIHYTFRVGTLKHQTNADGTILPHIKLTILRNGKNWGYIENHLHQVKVLPKEIDLSVGTTVRINPLIRHV